MVEKSRHSFKSYFSKNDVRRIERNLRIFLPQEEHEPRFSKLSANNARSGAFQKFAQRIQVVEHLEKVLKVNVFKKVAQVDPRASCSFSFIGCDEFWTRNF